MAQGVLDLVRPLSEKLVKGLPRIKDGEVAVFRLKNAFVKDGSREEPSCPEVVQMAGKQTIRDPGEKEGDQTKIMGTYPYKYKFTNGVSEPVYMGLTFIKGELKLTADREAEYIFAMRNIHNESNKYRKQMGGKSAPKFFLVGTKEVSTFIQMTDMKYHAEKMVRESGFEYLKQVATKLNESPDTRLHVKSFKAGFAENPDTMKYELIQLAHTFPKQVMAAHPDEKTRVRVQIYDAQVYGVLVFEKQAYQLDTNSEFVEIFKPEEDVDKVDSLINYFMSDGGTKHYTLFAQTLKKALSVRNA